MKKIYLYIFLVLTWCNPGYGYLVHGAYQCGEILSDDKDNNTTSMYQTKSYIQGYITARNYSANADVGENVKSQSLYYYVIKFCKDNPLKGIHHAAESIYLDLK